MWWLFSDWQRWSRAERLFAGLVGALLTVLIGVCVG
jgi:hypothetical protein